MILFWVICALLIVIALAFVLPPALQRSEKRTSYPTTSGNRRTSPSIAINFRSLKRICATASSVKISMHRIAKRSSVVCLKTRRTTRSKKTPAPRRQCTQYCLPARHRIPSHRNRLLSENRRARQNHESRSGRSASQRRISSTARTNAGTNRGKRSEACRDV